MMFDGFEWFYLCVCCSNSTCCWQRMAGTSVSHYWQIRFCSGSTASPVRCPEALCTHHLMCRPGASDSKQVMEENPAPLCGHQTPRKTPPPPHLERCQGLFILPHFVTWNDICSPNMGLVILCNSTTAKEAQFKKKLNEIKKRFSFYWTRKQKPHTWGRAKDTCQPQTTLCY